MSETEILWPESLPQSPLLDGWQETLADNVLRTEMEQGPAKLRRRSTVASGRMRAQFLLSAADCALLDTFYNDTLAGGVKVFRLLHPLRNVTIVCRFAAPPEYAAVNGEYCRARLSLEVMA